MARITVGVTLDAPPERVWELLEDIGSHVMWMQDAESIEFTSATTRGVGTTFDCRTRVGPFRLLDHMEVTAWSPGRRMGVRHVGLVTGDGSFRLRPRRRGRTRFVWSERLSFPWWMGGPVGALAASPVLRHVWRSNLRNLRALVDGEPVR